MTGRPPVDRASTFRELVEQALAELADDMYDRPLLDRDEDAVLADLADFQRRAGRSQRIDAFVAAVWRVWVEHSVHAAEWRSRLS